MKKYDIVCCGVGGQGIITLGQLLKIAGIKAGLRVNGTETRGATMREGSVSATVRLGIPEPGDEKEVNERSKIYAGTVGTGMAKMAIFSEPLEGLRNAFYLNPETIVIVNEYTMPSADHLFGGVHYPTKEEWMAKLKEFSERIYTLNANMIAKDLFGRFDRMNIVLIGFAMGIDPSFPISMEAMKETLQEQWPKAIEENTKALMVGHEKGMKARDA
ncbi:MAG: 2-oxoacid:acceptor oxidoreductase family protein [Candidatus Helarchaeales archaeon]